MENTTLLTAGAITLAVIAFETWFRVTSLKDMEKKQQEVAQTKASGTVTA